METVQMNLFWMKNYTGKFCFVLFLENFEGLKFEWESGGWIWEMWGVNMIKIYCMKSSKKITF